jgi:hypothetical protein
VSDPGEWVARRLAAAPGSLRRRIETALAAGAGGAEGAGDLAARLRVVAERLLVEAKSGPATRETAMTLLAADALITLSCEWTAEFAPKRMRDPA